MIVGLDAKQPSKMGIVKQTGENLRLKRASVQLVSTMHCKSINCVQVP